MRLRRNEKLLKKNHASLSPEEEEERLKLASRNYYLLKKFDFLLFSNDPRISEPNCEKRFNRVLNCYCNLNDLYHMVLDIDPLLKEAVEIKDLIHHFYKQTPHAKAKKELEDIIILCRTSKIKGMQDFSNTLCEWKQEIINSFIKIPSLNRKMNNALIENRNKSIKLLKHSSNGYTNWNRFRARILYTLNDDIHMKM